MSFLETPIYPSSLTVLLNLPPSAVLTADQTQQGPPHSKGNVGMLHAVKTALHRAVAGTYARLVQYCYITGPCRGCRLGLKRQALSCKCLAHHICMLWAVYGFQNFSQCWISRPCSKYSEQTPEGNMLDLHMPSPSCLPGLLWGALSFCNLCCSEQSCAMMAVPSWHRLALFVWHDDSST